MYKEEEQLHYELPTQPSDQLQPSNTDKQQSLPNRKEKATGVNDLDTFPFQQLPYPLRNKQSSTSDNHITPSILAQQLPNTLEHTELNQLIMLEDSQSDNNFAIGDDAQANIGRLSINIQIKDTFNILRQAIQKLLNEEEVSIQAAKMLPSQLQDDFYDFVGYVKEKILQIKDQNNLSFIMAEIGAQPQVEEDLSLSLPDFITKQSLQLERFQRLLEEKETLITSLLNQKTQQENTLNEHQNMQQEVEKLHLQQYSVMKGQIKHQKETMDRQLMQYESLKNIIKKNMMFWIDDEDNCDDFQDNLKLMTTIYQFNQKEKVLLHQYLQKYRSIKQSQ